jgi:hypothetical protein
VAHQQQGPLAHQRDGREVTGKTERQVLLYRREDGEGAVDHQHRVAIRRSLGDISAGDGAGCAGTEVIDEGLAEGFAQAWQIDLHFSVDRAARGQRDHHGDRLGGKGGLLGGGCAGFHR